MYVCMYACINYIYICIYTYLYRERERERFIYIQGLIEVLNLDKGATHSESAGWTEITEQMYEVRDNKSATPTPADAKVVLISSLIPHFKMVAKRNTDDNKETLEL